MILKTLVFSTVAAVFGLSSQAATTEQQARACFDEALATAKAGARPEELITKYLDHRSVAANAAAHTRWRSWDAVPESVKKEMIAAVHEWFADEETYDGLDLETVKALRGGKANGESFELAARYGAPEERVFFGLLIYVGENGRCRVIDASESGAWVSFAIGQMF